MISIKKCIAMQGDSINGFILKFLPKKKHFCRTIANPGCMYLALGIDSVGYQEYYHHLFIDLGLDMTPMTRTQHILILLTPNTISILPTGMCSTPWSNAVVFQDRFDKVLDQDNKLQKDKHKGLIYKCGMAGPTVPNKNNNKEAAAQLHLPTKSQSH
jgi:hypothetical protein